jgi:hypothetical protein
MGTKMNMEAGREAEVRTVEKTGPVMAAATRYPDDGKSYQASLATGKLGRSGKTARMMAKIRLCGTETVSPPVCKIPFKAPLDPGTLAKIASRLAVLREMGNVVIAVDQAIELFRAAETGSAAEKQERALLEGVFELDEPEWEAQITQYEGDLRILAARYEKTFLDVDFILQNLFRNKSETDQTRREKFVELVRFAQAAGHRLYSETGESLEVSEARATTWLAQEEINVLTCRWLVVARQRQIGECRREAALAVND